MPGYINLYDPALRRPREWVTLNSLVIAAAVLLAVMLALGAGLRWEINKFVFTKATYSREFLDVKSGSIDLDLAILELGLMF